MKNKKNSFFKNDKKFKEIKKGQKFTYKKKITANAIQKFASMIGDKNPLHFKTKKSNHKVVAHGMLIGSFVSTLLGSFFPIKNNVLVSMNLNFKFPVYPGDEIKIIASITNKSEINNIIILKIDIYNYKKLSVFGEAIVKVNL